MTRRCLLAAASGAPLIHAQPVETIDTHVHFYDPTRPQGVPWPRKDETRLYRRVMPEDYPDPNARVIIVEASPWLEDNQWILDLAAKHPHRICGCVGNLDPTDTAFAANLARFQRNPLFLGIRLSSGRMEAAIDKLAPLAQANLTLDLIGNAEMFTWAARLSDRYPGLRIVLDHLPLPKRDASIALLRGRANVFAKVSWILRGPSDAVGHHRESLDEILDVFGENRVLYGTNWPVSDLSAPFEKVQAAAFAYFSTKAFAKYRALNSKAAYRWPSASGVPA